MQVCMFFFEIFLDVNACKCYRTVGNFCSLRNYTALLAGDGFGAVAASGDGVC